MASRILVTGGSGFIGHHLVRRLLREGHAVYVMTRHNLVERHERLRDVWHKLHIIEADIRNRGAMEGMPQFDGVFHLAAFHHVGESWKQYEECFDVNSKGTANVIEAVGGDARIVYVSSSEVYGKQPHVPWTEDMPAHPVSPYAITKYSGEMYAQMKQEMGWNVAIARPFNTFGPYQAARAVIPKIICTLLQGETLHTTEGKQTREFNYVDDILDGLMLLAKADKAPDGPINFASGNEISIKDLTTTLADLVEKYTGKRSKIIRDIPYRPREVWRMKGDAWKAHTELGWSSQRRGFEDTVKWFVDYHERNNGNLWEKLGNSYAVKA